MEEVWKDVSGYEGFYRISNLGRIKSLKPGTRIKDKSGYLTPSVREDGYNIVTLYKNRSRKKWLVHRLVALHFVDNPKGYPHINHMDENKSNNRADNLEWCDIKYNNRYGTAIARKIETSSIPVAQVAENNTIIAVYKSARIASSVTGVGYSSIQLACRMFDNFYTAKGYRWKYLSKTETSFAL